MIETAESLIETPTFAAAVPGPAGPDVVSDVLRVFRVNGAALLRGEFNEPWAWETPPASVVARFLHPGASRLFIFHIVAKGSCWVEVEGEGRTNLSTGDIIGFPHGQAHRMGSGKADVVHVTSILPPLPWSEMPRLSHGGTGALTRLVCVYLRCDDLPFNPLLSCLPSLLVVRRDAGHARGWFASNVRYLIREAAEGRAGAACLIARLTEMMFIEIVRLHMSDLDGRGVGLLAGLNDRYVGRALQALHHRPLDPWTSERIARQAGLSRSAFEQRFRRLLKLSPIRYLTMWRLQLAAQSLLHSDVTIAEAAARAGYGSEEAFSRAFHRMFGAAPASWRRGRLEA